MEIGTVVSLKVKNPLWDRRKAYAFPIEEYRAYTGKVLPSPSWVGADQICISTGNDRFAFRVIDRDRIEGFSEAREKPEDSVWAIAGTGGKSYVVALSRGSWSCNCTGFGYRQTCSHVVSAKSLKSQGNKKVEKSEEKCCFNIKAAVESNSRKVKRGASAPLKDEVQMAKLTKTAMVVEIMAKNASRPMAEVSRIIETQLPCKEGYGKVWYRWAVKEGVAPGVLEKTARAPKAKAKVAKASKVLEKVAKAQAKSAEDVAAIKAKNLATLKSVSVKHKKYNQIAREEGPGVENFDADEARAEVAMMLAEDGQLPSWENKASYTKDEMKYMI